MTLDLLDRPEIRPTALDSDSDSELTDRLALEMAEEEPSELPEEKSETPLERSEKLFPLLLFRWNRVATAATPAATGTSYSSPTDDEDNGGLLEPPLAGALIDTSRGVS